VARPELHSEQAILDAARSVVTEAGPRAVTVAAIANASAAPTGSIYHRFGSVDELLARLWLRAVRRSQGALFEFELDHDAGVVQAALAQYDFCLANREDALLLGAFRRAELLQAELPLELRRELETANAPIEAPLGRLARRLSGGRGSSGLDLALLAVVDLPYGFARRYLDADASPSPERRRRLEAAVRALLGTDTASDR
jgi:AcrR family transcriptional regulator